MVGSIDTPNNWSRLPLSPDDGDRLLKNGAALIPRLKHAEVLAENIGLRPVRKWGVRIEYEEVAPDLKARYSKRSEVNELNYSFTHVSLGAAQLRSRGLWGDSQLGMRRGGFQAA